MEFNSPILNQQARGQSHNEPTPKKKRSKLKLINTITVTLLISVALLVGAIIFITSTTEKSSESNLVDKSKFQAVFLQGGQVYFGKIKTINKEYVAIDSIYYLKVNESGTETTTANQDVSLTRLGCELHGPQDLMVISKSNVTFWENLKDDGQVAEAINKFIQQNPNGQTCANANTSTTEQQSTAQPQQSTEQSTEQQVETTLP